ncbi:MAG: hypothetical protein ABR600_04230 [Actinomycetota bacterium]
MSSDTYRGERVGQLPRRNRTYDAGRTCAEPGCTTRLSIYNRASHCWQHEPVRTFVSRGKRKRREAA